ncbi:GntR family transcriptional regulator [Haloactinomyces albus]|uniref:DNA-binding GntR family transcriptional regulator n=1 Tax=Haloactinomyces albus TaxID=1352928 RepID=A0AAE3ZEU2_9ACTN|nr:GntR family transcriptional regulator [Haloactinomyces albus]MDR7303636.1 DNA-binding GntR family transcriptional regulator [Haloactinomyces albus]
MEPTPLTRRIATRIVEHIRGEQLPVGARLVERTLAAQLRVSRSPIRSALRLLEQDGVVAVTGKGGYTVLRGPAELPEATAEEDTGTVENMYLRIAADRLDGNLPNRVTESGLARDYDLTPAQLSRILQRINAEGWIERLPGYGWQFQPTLTSQQSYEDSYRFRLTIEPAAILEPNFALDREAILEVRDQQQRLADGDIWHIGNAELFDLNSTFHETVMQCSGNTFFIDSLHRIDRLRRLVEYRRSLPRDRAIIRCREHIAIADLLLEDRREEATELMRTHLSTVSAEKVAVGE